MWIYLDHSCCDYCQDFLLQSNSFDRVREQCDQATTLLHPHLSHPIQQCYCSCLWIDKKKSISPGTSRQNGKSCAVKEICQNSHSDSWGLHPRTTVTALIAVSKKWKLPAGSYGAQIAVHKCKICESERLFHVPAHLLPYPHYYYKMEKSNAFSLLCTGILR